jgi:nicotinate-nucleotide--dimethylbenzimidazole phosphoribosyltransferase
MGSSPSQDQEAGQDLRPQGLAGACLPAAIATAIARLEPADEAWRQRAAQRQATLTMPPGSLGRLLDLGQHLAALQRTDQPLAAPAVVAVFAADHGIAACGTSAYPQAVTGQMVANFLRGGAAVNVLARGVGATVRVADLGVAFLPEHLQNARELHSHPIRPGTSSFLDGPAMTREEAYRAVTVGVMLGERWIDEDGFRVVALGEMGIGNSTTAAALTAALTGATVDLVVGRGTGLDDQGLARKRTVVTQALERHAKALDDPWECAARLGGFEILGLAGLALAAAGKRAMVVLDGFISSVAGLLAARFAPLARDAMVASHLSPEPGHRVVLDALDLRPLFDLGLRLGEGSGATLALPLIAASADILRDMATFEGAGVAGPS